MSAGVPSLFWRRTHRTGGHQARVPDCRRAGTCSREPGSFYFAAVTGRWLTRARRSMWEVCWVLGPAPERRVGCALGARGGCGSGRAQTLVRSRGGHTPQTAPCACGEPAELTVTEATRECLSWSAGASPVPLLSRVSPYAVATGFSSRPRGWLRGHLVISSPSK